FKAAMMIILVSSAHKLTAATYYINSRVGDDTNTGTSINLPWKSLINLEKNTFAPGDSILFAKGSVYEGGFVFTSSGTAGIPIVFSSYSAGADLILNTPRRELSPLWERYGAGHAPAFTNPNWEHLNGNIFRIEGNYIVIDGLYFHDNVNPPVSNSK